MADYYGSGHAISKILSANDVGLTGGHQGGIVIPKRQDILSFFPHLDSSVKNPRIELLFEDQNESIWKFMFIYYNGKLFGGTRNEYRLTHMTNFIRQYKLKTNDEVLFFSDGSEFIKISVNVARRENAIREGVIRLGSGWKTYNFKEKS